MKITDVLAPYKHFTLATREDNQEILDFFNSITMDTKSFSLRYDRGNDFFAFANEQTDDYFLFLMRDENGKVKGTAAIAFINHLLNGKVERCGYLGDLRISPTLNAKIRITWKKCYGDIIENFQKIDEFQGVRYLYSAILNDNEGAMRSLLKNNDRIIYHELTKYKTLNIIKPWPFTYLKKSRYQIVNASLLEIKNFLSENISKEGLALDLEAEFIRRLSKWKNFSEKSFRVVKDQSNNVVAIYAPWTSETKKLIIEKMNNAQKFISKLTPLLGIRSLNEKEAIEVLYLTHLTLKRGVTQSESEEILTAIIMSLFKMSRTFHTASLFIFKEQGDLKLPFFTEETHATLYQVMNRTQFENREFIDLKGNPPAFEIGIA